MSFMRKELLWLEPVVPVRWSIWFKFTFTRDSCPGDTSLEMNVVECETCGEWWLDCWWWLWWWWWWWWWWWDDDDDDELCPWRGRKRPSDFRRIRLMDETDGSVSRPQIPSKSNFSRISQANSDWFTCLYSWILAMTSGVDTRGFDPPVKRGKLNFFRFFCVKTSSKSQPGTTKNRFTKVACYCNSKGPGGESFTLPKVKPVTSVSARGQWVCDEIRTFLLLRAHLSLPRLTYCTG